MIFMLFWGGIALTGCFFSILVIPFARVPLTMDSIMLCVLYPVDFFLGSVAFFISFMSHALLLQHISLLRKSSPIKSIIGLFMYATPISLIQYSAKMVLVFFLFSFMYSFITLLSYLKQRKKTIKERG
ncbi:hypothetical protein [Pontibacillus sp. HMF3514]|uniref:hypothetical protein n=1 Tax=Pontibacillus sp. HMF3514 TaxID=2692425 RepID=UPI00131FB8A9|nr:hypothetical protein [Pontibacillus sp. HMF3514]QHE52546.1 hypothetical protein GS400_11110 [Pontibacillus sp. HMF3514]